MAKFTITERSAAWVDVTYEIEAENEQEARSLYNEGQATFISEVVLDNIDFLPNSVVVEPY